MRPKITHEETVDGFKFYKACREINLLTGKPICEIYKMLGAVPGRVSQIKRGKLRAPLNWQQIYLSTIKENKNSKTTVHHVEREKKQESKKQDQKEKPGA